MGWLILLCIILVIIFAFTGDSSHHETPEDYWYLNRRD